MSVKRNILFMGSSTVVRIGLGMLTFVVMARYMGPDKFGTLMLWVSIGSLINFISNYGMTPYVLRHSALKEHHLKNIFCDVFSAKIILSAVAITTGVLVATYFISTISIGYYLVLLALMLDTWTELFNVCFRVTNKFSKETKYATLSSIVQLLIIFSFVNISKSIDVIAFGFLLARGVVLFVSWYAQRNIFSGVRCFDISHGVRMLKQSSSYAADYCMQNLFGQIDSVVINLFYGMGPIGVYQSGMRLFLGAAQTAGILVNVFVPRVSSATSDARRLDIEANLLQNLFLASGLFLGLFFVFFPQWLVDVLFGQAFSSLGQLTPYFGLLFFIRFIAASFGVILTSIGEQKYRAWINLAHWILIACLAPWLVPLYGPKGWLIVLSIANSVLALAYYAKVVFHVSFNFLTYLSVGISFCIFAISFYSILS